MFLIRINCFGIRKSIFTRIKKILKEITENRECPDAESVEMINRDSQGLQCNQLDVKY